MGCYASTTHTDLDSHTVADGASQGSFFCQTYKEDKIKECEEQSAK